MSKCIFTNIHNFNFSLRKKSHIYLAVYHLHGSLGYIVIYSLRNLWEGGREGMITHIFQNKPRFWWCPAHKSAGRRWQNQDSTYILSDSKSRVHSHPRNQCITAWWQVIMQLAVQLIDLVLRSSRSVYWLAIFIWVLLVGFTFNGIEVAGYQWPLGGPWCWGR